MKIFKIFLNLLILLILTVSCAYEKVDQRQRPDGAKAKARKNIEEGRGASIGNILKRRGGDFEFSSANPMWRATLDTLDFLPLTTVDYSGGMIITDWYSESNSNDSIKITVRFLGNEVRTENLKIIVHKKICSTGTSCKTSLINSGRINEELLASIITKAALLEKEDKKKK